MTRWTAVVVGAPDGEKGPMVSRLPTFLHPVAGRPLIWHTVNALSSMWPQPTEAIVLASPELTKELFDDLPFPVRVLPLEAASEELTAISESLPDRTIVAPGTAYLEPQVVQPLVEAPEGSWIGGPDGPVAAMALASSTLRERLGSGAVPGIGEGASPELRLPEQGETFVVANRVALARAHRRIRDHLVRALMDSGATFLNPESVVVDVDVRIGRDAIVYPGAVLEGQTTIGEETVVGPGCRIIDSWIGSGVELKGWNYIAHTSVRNRAILEPYVRRGFD